MGISNSEGASSESRAASVPIPRRHGGFEDGEHMALFVLEAGDPKLFESPRPRPLDKRERRAAL